MYTYVNNNVPESSFFKFRIIWILKLLCVFRWHCLWCIYSMSLHHPQWSQHLQAAVLCTRYSTWSVTASTTRTCLICDAVTGNNAQQKCWSYFFHTRTRRDGLWKVIYNNYCPYKLADVDIRMVVFVGWLQKHHLQCMENVCFKAWSVGGSVFTFGVLSFLAKSFYWACSSWLFVCDQRDDRRHSDRQQKWVLLVSWHFSKARKILTFIWYFDTGPSLCLF